MIHHCIIEWFTIQ